MNENRCVCCGAIIPEGLQVCPICEQKEQKQIKQTEKLCSILVSCGFMVAILGVAIWWVAQLV